MKIYQLHQYGGEWEDSYDYIVGSYLRKERAEEAMAIFQRVDQIKVKESRQCCCCPLFNSSTDDSDKLKEECIAYCDRFRVAEYDDGGIDCDNWQSYYDEPMYCIKEVEVEE